MTPKNLEVQNLSVKINGDSVLKSVSLDASRGEILALIGPAGSGKTTLLRVLNRLVELDKDIHVEGLVKLNGQSILDQALPASELRRKIGLVFSVPTPLPLSIYDNMVFGPKLINSKLNRAQLSQQIEKCLKAAYLWEEVKNRLNESALKLSGGQQQRLCLARTLALDPEVLLLDEPCSGLDPISTAQIEEALNELKQQMAILLVTNNVKQASRVSDKTAFLLMGELIEKGSTDEFFTNPKNPKTEAYITGRFG